MDWRDRKTCTLLGQTVTVRIDRPVGYLHGDILYPINYGFVPGLMGGDGEAQDAYILGINEPIESFSGTVIGIIQRHNDCEDKLVLAPAGMRFHQAQIAEAVHFQEQYFEYSITCLNRKSCGILPWRETDGKREYLIVFEQFSQCWSLPKGHMEPGETELETALRELREETGLIAEADPNARISTEYPDSPMTRKEMVIFLGKVHGDVHVQQSEIITHRWVSAEALRDYLFPDTAAAIQPLL